MSAKADRLHRDAEVIDLDPARRHADAEPRPVLVDSVEAQRPQRRIPEGIRTAERHPILPAWARSLGDLRATLGWVALHYAHAGTYHGLRVPKYAGRLLARTPRGASRAISTTARWGADTEGRPVRREMAARKDRDSAETYLKLVKRRDQHQRNRGTVALIAAVVAVGLGLWLWLAASPLAQAAALAAAITTLGILGAPADRPLLDTAVVISRASRLTSEIVTRALGVLGLAGIDQAIRRDGNKAIRYAAPITRDGPGWRADIDLPPGVTAAEVIERRDKLASGLGRPLGCCWPEAVPEVSPARLMLWVGDQDVAAARQPAWPLARHGTVDLFKPFPFGTDPRGRPVPLELVYTNMLIGSIPGAGKTFSLRLPLLAAALDPLVELWTFELKGTGDLEPLAQVSHRYASGLDDDTIEEALQALRDLRRECVRRAAAIEDLPHVQAPENKVTPALAGRRQLGLHLLVCAIDEVQELFSHPTYGREAADLAERVIKLGRALGIILLLATQRPDKDSVPTGVSANVGTRFCLRVMGQVENDMILGTSAYKNGIRATMFTKRDRGVGYLVGGEDPQIVRTYYVDGPAAERIVGRARAAREAAGTLRGYALGQDGQGAKRRDTLLDDVLGGIPTTEDKTPAEVLRERLAEAHPDLYGEQTVDQLTAGLRAHGIDTTVQVHRTGEDGQRRNRRGITRQQIAEVATERDRKRGIQ